MKINPHAPGTIWPREYNWESNLAPILNSTRAYAEMDIGKIRGLALAHKELLRSVENLLKQKGRFNTEQAYRELEAAFKEIK